MEAAIPPTRLTFDLVDDGEPAQVVDFPRVAASDSRYFRAFAFKPTREGVYRLVLTAYDATGNVLGAVSCPGVTVTP